jgi:ribosomal protein S18 acetylase RimI-like enzyme
MGMNIRKAIPKDAKGIALVLTTSYNIKDEKEGIEVFRSETKKGRHYLIAEKNKKIIGLVTWLPHGLPKHMLAELDRIAVLPEYRGKGVSKDLKEAMIADAQAWFKGKGHRLRKVYLMTHEDNSRARAFYEKMGFKLETTLKDHYYKGKDECVYSIFFR